MSGRGELAWLDGDAGMLFGGIRAIIRAFPKLAMTPAEFLGE